MINTIAARHTVTAPRRRSTSYPPAYVRGIASSVWLDALERRAVREDRAPGRPGPMKRIER